MRTSEAFLGRNEFGMGCRDTELTTDELLRACVDNLLSLGWRVSTIWHELGMTGLQKCSLTACPYSRWWIARAWAADARGTAAPAFMNVPFEPRVVMVALGTPTAVPAEHWYLDSTHHTTGVTCRRCSRWCGRGGVSWGRGLLTIFVCSCHVTVAGICVRWYSATYSSHQKHKKLPLRWCSWKILILSCFNAPNMQANCSNDQPKQQITSVIPHCANCSSYTFSNENTIASHLWIYHCCAGAQPVTGHVGLDAYIQLAQMMSGRALPEQQAVPSLRVRLSSTTYLSPSGTDIALYSTNTRAGANEAEQ